MGDDAGTDKGLHLDATTNDRASALRQMLPGMAAFPVGGRTMAQTLGHNGLAEQVA